MSTVGFCVYWATHRSNASCKEEQSDEEEIVGNDRNITSDNEGNCTKKKEVSNISIWSMLYGFLKPDLLWLVLAIPVFNFLLYLVDYSLDLWQFHLQSALLSAYFNIKINLALGDLLNVIQTCLQTSMPSGDNFLATFINLVKEPATNLLTIYFFQVRIIYTIKT